MATVSSTVELLIKAQQPQRALSALTQSTDKLKQRLNATQGAFNKAGQAGANSASRAGNAYKNLGTEVSGVNNIVRTLRTSFVALGGAVTASGILQAGTDAIEAERRIKLLAASSGDTEQALQIASRAASKFGLSSTEANEGVARLLARLKPMGVSLEDIESTFAGFNIAAKLAGATASESSGAFLQLTQALGSGVLRGQELNSILEQAPLIATAIALEMNTTTGSLKKLGEEGKITSKIVLAALKRVETEGAEKLEEAMKGPAQQFKNLRNAGVELSKVLTKNLLPAIIPLVQGATNLLKSFNELPAGIQTFIVTTTLATGAVVVLTKTIAILAASKIGAFLAQQIALFQVFGAKIYFAAAAAGALKIAMAALPFGAVALGIGLLTTALINHNRKQKEFNDLIKFGGEEALKTAINTEQLRKTQAQERIDKAGPTGRMGKNSPFQRRMRRIIADADARIAQLQKRAGQIKTVTPLTPTPELDEDTKGERLKNRLARRSLEQLNNANDLVRARQQENQQLELQIEKGKEFADFTQRVRDLVEKGVPFSEAFELEDAIRKNEKIIEQQEKQNQLVTEIGQTISAGIVDSLMRAKSASEALGGVLNSVARQLISFGLGSIGGMAKGSGSGILGAVGDIFRANGGPVTGGRSYIVGERGPEVFTPGVSGGITPNSALGGANVTVNVDASGSSVQGDGPSASQLGKAIGAAVQAELIKQKRPGGLLTR